MKIPYGKQTIDKEDVLAVIGVLESDFLTTGPKVKEFEESFAAAVGAKYAVAVSSGTAALHLACMAIGLKESDEVITSPMTFVASSNCVLYCNAKPVFVDITKNGLIDNEKIEEKITSKTKAIIPVHYSGLICDMSEINRVAKKHKLYVIEDACHALGAKYENSKAGDCEYSDLAIFSFHPVKHITTAEGGMITTNSKQLYEKLLMLRTHGITRDQNKLIKNNPEPWYYEMQELGYNYRITDVQCALGASQLKKLPKFIELRRDIAKKYNSFFKDLKDITILKEKENQFNSYHLYLIKVKNEETRLKLFNYLHEKGIFCQVHYIPVYWQPYYKKIGYSVGICPNAEEFYKRIISLPIYPGLTREEQEYVIDKIREFIIKSQKNTI
ncbi:UDP-4-amino-4,6-dideoxy-N-acetyl-beta-L-altrosamine transaminase [Candidatus Pacearchaeota archaeon CG10_big_fil_rev_8_21_14_0_10_34_76]|nr:MAG: UDP-4-amino-4,6-dideoxy-N-acetyl-beta-L-altrosamine transaminase [Candidatus Pacearchaeota archaeon CG10_big_fil_rev_8_21_14_0_10_34_76]